MSKKVQTVGKVVESMMRFAKKLSNDGQSAIGVKMVLYAEKVEKAVEAERKRVLDQIWVLSGLIKDCRMESAKLKMATRMREQQHYYGN